MKIRTWIVAATTLALAVLVPLFIVGCSKNADTKATTQAVKYHCPMHPSVVSDKPGNCPICSMKLVPMEGNTQRESSSASSSATVVPTPAKKKTMYRSTMNPGEISNKPGKDSMGMDMVPYEMEESTSTVSGLATVSIASEARQRMGLTLGTVEKRSIDRTVRTSARIAADETQLYRVTTKIDGWVEKLSVSYMGQAVKKGDPLLTIYSPSLVSAEQEYLIALDAARKLARSSDTDSAAGSVRLVEAAKLRLSLWDISDDQVQRLEKTHEVEKTLTLYAPADGIVVEKNVLAGQKITAGDSLLVVADLTTVWADADIYESDLQHVGVGMLVKITLPYWPGKVFRGKVIFVSPTLDPQSRTMKARIEIANPDQLLKPEMFADASLAYDMGDRLAIPETAVMYTGERVYAFKDVDGNRLAPVEIKIGARADGWYELVSGLNEGDRVVTSANFLVDSESSMRGALAAMSGSATVSETKPAEHKD